MVQVFSPSPRAMQNAQIGQSIGQGIGLNAQQNLLSQALFGQNSNKYSSLPLDQQLRIAEFQNTAMQRNLTAENDSIKRLYGVDLSGIQDPATRQAILSQQIPLSQKLKMAKGDENVNYSGFKKNELPSFADQLKGNTQSSNQNIETQTPYENRTNLNPQSQKPVNVTPKNIETSPNQSGVLPKPQTGLVKKPVLDAQGLIEEADNIRNQRNANGNPTTFETAYNIAKAFNDENTVYNQKVDKDIQDRALAEEEYGKLGEQKLLNVLPTATDEQKALFQRKGEEAASEKGATQSSINKKLSEDARIFKNSISNIKKSLPAPRLFSNIGNKILDRDREFDKTRNGLRIKLKPLLDESLYDTARNLLSEIGYHPEEREAIVSDLGEGSRKALSNLNQIKEFDWKYKDNILENYYNDNQKEQIHKALIESFKNEPSVNTILLRQAFNEKGVDWREFKDQLDRAIIDGEITLNPDQFNSLNNLDEPPYNQLEKILHKLKLY